MSSSSHENSPFSSIYMVILPIFISITPKWIRDEKRLPAPRLTAVSFFNIYICFCIVPQIQYTYSSVHGVTLPYLSVSPFSTNLYFVVLKSYNIIYFAAFAPQVAIYVWKHTCLYTFICIYYVNIYNSVPLSWRNIGFHF